jgi:hypothetical protein
LDPAVRRGPRRFTAFFHAARVPGAPLQSFPFPGSRTRSRGPLLPCGFALRLPPAQCPREIHDRFPGPRQLVAARAHPKVDPGRMSRDGRSSRSLVRSPRRTQGAPHVPSSSHQHWARRLAAGTPTSKPCSPRESVPRRPHRLARLRPPVGALLGFSPFRAFSTTVRGSVTRVSTRGGLEAPHPRAPPGARPSRLHSATRSPTPGLASPGSVDTQSLENPAHHRQATTQLTKRL